MAHGASLPVPYKSRRPPPAIAAHQMLRQAKQRRPPFAPKRPTCSGEVCRQTSPQHSPHSSRQGPERRRTRESLKGTARREGRRPSHACGDGGGRTADAKKSRHARSAQALRMAPQPPAAAPPPPGQPDRRHIAIGAGWYGHLAPAAMRQGIIILADGQTRI
eukprot:CAMPEP_0181177408 /NCGR_PEP_ID=MMETSP1096-20121128/5145_1 /TAXON_ID=156174 ORGANISM="Chrysochromulina ericina, Strain CCMP281" /NCGR_SAMPLE_ID=MMETSP1096 /ASSEMBLY_ACC=CAM_ASM_000453 /LENGTH=161 /DNA_ID=CAMNT_0023265557 /DNA_START=1192 /DNA_END=1674 /DNA_ORIENTATION=-